KGREVLRPTTPRWTGESPRPVELERARTASAADATACHSRGATSPSRGHFRTVFWPRKDSKAQPSTGSRCQCSYRQQKTFSVPKKAPTTAEIDPSGRTPGLQALSQSCPLLARMHSIPFPVRTECHHMRFSHDPHHDG